MKKIFFLLVFISFNYLHAQNVIYGIDSSGHRSPILIFPDGSPSTKPVDLVIPSTFTEQTSNGRVFTLQKGQINKLRLRPRIINEQQESSREVMDTVNSSKIVGQVFRASQDNINGINITLESANISSIDNFESYANSDSLQSYWEETDVSDPATLGTVIVNTGTKSMSLPMDATVNDEWQKTLTSTDYTDYTFTMDFYQNKPYASASVKFYIGDGTNTKSIDLVVQDEDTWENFDIDVNSMTEDGGTTDITAITEIGFRLVNRSNSTDGYVNNLITSPPPGSIGLTLWDMGATRPVGGVNKINDGTQYKELGDRGINGGVVVERVELSLLGGTREYDVRTFVAGVASEIPSNTLLTVGNYYIISLEYIDTDVLVYGANSSFGTDYYQSGFAFTAADTSTVFDSLGTNKDMMFCLFSVQDIYLNTLIKIYDSAPGTLNREVVTVENRNMKRSIIANSSQAFTPLEAEFTSRAFYMEKGGKFEVTLSDDFSDSATTVSVLIGYLFIPPTPYN